MNALYAFIRNLIQSQNVLIIISISWYIEVEKESDLYIVDFIKYNQAVSMSQ